MPRRHRQGIPTAPLILMPWPNMMGRGMTMTMIMIILMTIGLALPRAPAMVRPRPLIGSRPPGRPP
jgi:hypothetical protein